MNKIKRNNEKQAPSDFSSSKNFETMSLRERMSENDANPIRHRLCDFSFGTSKGRACTPCLHPKVSASFSKIFLQTVLSHGNKTVCGGAVCGNFPGIMGEGEKFEKVKRRIQVFKKSFLTNEIPEKVPRGWVNKY